MPLSRIMRLEMKESRPQTAANSTSSRLWTFPTTPCFLSLSFRLRPTFTISVSPTKNTSFVLLEMLLVPTLKKRRTRGGNAPDALFCTKLLRFSLLSSLSRILRNNSANLSLDQVSFSDMPRGSVVLTGSTIVQCLSWRGLEWKRH